MSKAILLVVTTFNCWKYSKIAFDSIKKIDLSSIEVLIIDDHSTRVNYERIAEEYNFNFIGKEIGKGLTDSWNIAYKYFIRGRYKYLILSNNDVLIPKGTIELLIKYIDIPDTVMCVPSGIIGSTCPFQTLNNIDNMNILDHKNYQKTQDILLSIDCIPKIHTQTFNGFFFVMNREIISCAYDTNNLFSPHTINIENELDLNKRIRLKEKKVYYIPNAFIYHFKAKTVGRNNRDNLALIHSRDFIEDYNKIMKICVYAISKNEEKHVKRFCDSASLADLIVICDTGSTDKTIESAKECGATVYDIRVKPWRFDLARNIALGLVPADVDICITLDLDEILLPGWREEIERVWKLGETNILQHHKIEAAENSQPYEYPNVFSRQGWTWKGICHEKLYIDPRLKKNWTFSNKVLVKHMPDKSKSREMYVDLLKANVEEAPNDLFVIYTYARELYVAKQYEECIRQANKMIELCPPDINQYDPDFSKYELNYMYLLKGSCYVLLGNYEEAVKNYKIACDMNLGIRQPFITLAMLYFEHQEYGLCYECCIKALEIKKKINRRDEALWRFWGYSPLSYAAIAAAKIGLKDKAIEYGKKALELSIKEAPEKVEELKKNLKIYEKLKNTEIDWIIYIVFHKYIYPEFYKSDPQFSSPPFIFLKTEGYNPKDESKLLDYYRDLGFEVFEEKSFPIYDKTLQPSKYHAPSAIYHSYKNNVHKKNQKYIGFMEYDLEIPESFTNSITKLIKNHSLILLSVKHKFNDLNDPHIRIDHKLWIDVILEDYNDFFSTNHTKEELRTTNPIIGTQQSFICDSDTFEKLGQFLVYLIDNKDKRNRKYDPRPSTLFERYIMIFMNFVESKTVLTLTHRALGQGVGTYAN